VARNIRIVGGLSGRVMWGRLPFIGSLFGGKFATIKPCVL
jgi:hypothetical protein